MKKIETILSNKISEAIQCLYNSSVAEAQIQIQQTRKEFEGDLTVVVFPFLKISKKSPEHTAQELGSKLKETCTEIKEFNVVKGFLNIAISETFWISFFQDIFPNKKFGFLPEGTKEETIMVEYSSPNTNKPLHLGHIRNNLLGFSIAGILKANGYKVIMANLINDRGIHICKSMLAWQKWGNNETPQNSGKKGDHLVGDYYVLFDKEYKKEISTLVLQGIPEEKAKKEAPLILQAQELLRKWEAKDPETIETWKLMNSWVYKGFEETYLKLGVKFDRFYYESETYLLGKGIVNKGLEQGILFQNEDKSIWIDLTSEGLDQKLLLRSDGTSVYMTQDLGTAVMRTEEYNSNQLIYVVGNEQDYHFKVLALVLKKLGYEWADRLYHLSYGMVELPEGKMKSREGTVVDADDLVAEMIQTAEITSQELGKLDSFSETEKQKIHKIIGLGALKYFILKVDPKKNMTFNPKESIDFNGNTGPFLQYTYTRIRSLMRKALELNIKYEVSQFNNIQISKKELGLLKQIYQFPEILKESGDTYNPALIANYTYDLVKEYNQFYHDYPVIKEDVDLLRNFRLALSEKISEIIYNGLELLGIEMPEKM